MKELCILAALLLATSNVSHGQRPVPKGPYLGQQPPGSTPIPFAPGLVTTGGWEYGGTFSPDLEEFYFLREVDAETNPRQEFVVFRHKNESWRESVISPRVGQPFISPDGKTMHLGRRYKERSGDAWSEIKPLGAPFDDMPIMRLTASKAGTYFLDEPGTDGDGVIRYSRLIDGQHESPRPLPGEINTGTWNAHPFVAPDESYLIWDGRRDDGYGDSDLYISFREPDGSWGEAMNFGDTINTAAWEAAASVTPDGKYLFFNRNVGTENFDNVDIFWVDARVIEELKTSARQ